MKVCELFNPSADDLVLLQEIVLIGDNAGPRITPSSLARGDKSKRKLVFKIDGNPVYEYPTIAHLTPYALEINDEIASIAEFQQDVTFNQRLYDVVRNLITIDKFKGHNYGIKLLQKYRKFRHDRGIISDDKMTNSGRVAWKKAITKLNAKIFDVETNKMLPLSAVSDDKVFVHDESKDRYLYIIESGGKSLLERKFDEYHESKLMYAGVFDEFSGDHIVEVFEQLSIDM